MGGGHGPQELSRLNRIHLADTPRPRRRARGIRRSVDCAGRLTHGGRPGTSRSTALQHRRALEPQDPALHARSGGRDEPVPDDAPAVSRWRAFVRKYLPERSFWTSWSIAPFYTALLILGAGVVPVSDV